MQHWAQQHTSCCGTDFKIPVLGCVSLTMHVSENKLLTYVFLNPWFFTTKDPPTHSHTRRRNTPVSQFFCPWEKSEEETTSITAVLFHQFPNTELLHLHYSPLKLNPIQWFHFSQIPLGFWVASICASLNVIHFSPARISSFTLSCPQRTNQKSSRHFTRPAWHHKHPAHGKFTAVARSQFTPNWQISLLGRPFAIVWHPVWQAELKHIPGGVGMCIWLTGEVQ